MKKNISKNCVLWVHTRVRKSESLQYTFGKETIKKLFLIRKWNLSLFFYFLSCITSRLDPVHINFSSYSFWFQFPPRDGSYVRYRYWFLSTDGSRVAILAMKISKYYVPENKHRRYCIKCRTFFINRNRICKYYLDASKGQRQIYYIKNIKCFLYILNNLFVTS